MSTLLTASRKATAGGSCSLGGGQLEQGLGADALVLAIDVDAVYSDWGTPDARAVSEATGGRSVIGQVEELAGLIDGTAGTVVAAEQAKTGRETARTWWTPEEDHPVVACFHETRSADVVQLGATLATAMQQPLVVAPDCQYRPLAVSSRVVSTPGNSKRSEAAQAQLDRAKLLVAQGLEVRERVVQGPVILTPHGSPLPELDSIARIGVAYDCAPSAATALAVGRHAADPLGLTTAAAH